MFLKLLKYDLLHGKNGFFGLAAALLAAAVVFRFTMDFFADAVIPLVGATLISSVTHMVVAIMTIIFIHQGFAKTFFGDHGYLIFTLPVKRRLLLASKVMTSLLWLNFMLLIAVAGGSILTMGHGGQLMFDQMDIIAWFAFVHYNVLGFLALSIFFFIIALSKATIRGRSIHFVFAAIVGALIFAAWAQVNSWFFRHVAYFGQFGFGRGELLNPFNPFADEPIGYLVRYDFFLMGSAVVFGLGLCLAILKLFKYMELK